MKILFTLSGAVSLLLCNFFVRRFFKYDSFFQLSSSATLILWAIAVILFIIAIYILQNSNPEIINFLSVTLFVIATLSTLFNPAISVYAGALFLGLAVALFFTKEDSPWVQTIASTFCVFMGCPFLHLMLPNIAFLSVISRVSVNITIISSFAVIGAEAFDLIINKRTHCHHLLMNFLMTNQEKGAVNEI